MNETQIENREANRIDQFQQRKWAEELTNGMALHNAALEQQNQRRRDSDHQNLCNAEGEAAAT